MRTYKLYLIRHGMTNANVEGQYIGLTDVEITTNGIIELKKLREENVYPKCDMVFSSPLKRAVKSAEIIFPGQEININKNLTEINFGEFEGKTPAELKDREDYKKWIKGEIQSAPGGESNFEYASRLCVGIGEIVKELMEKGLYSAGVVMHGGSIMTLLSVAAVPRRKMVEWNCLCGRGYKINITPSIYQRSGVLEVVDTIAPLAKDDD